MTVPPVEPPVSGGDIPQPPQPPPPPAPPVPPLSGGSGSQKNDTALYSLIAGIASIFCFGFLSGIPAIIMGKSGLKKAAAMGGEGEGQAKAGLILGIIGTALSLIGIIIWIFAAVVFVSSADSISDRADKITKNANKSLDEYNKRAERNGEEVDSDKFEITDEDVLVEDYGYVTYSAKLTNDDDFKTGYTVTVTCEGSEGDVDSNDVYIDSLREDGTKSFETTFYFDQETTDATCSVDEVDYGY